jgi:hypothetical protein
MNRRFLAVMVAYAVIHAVGWLMCAYHVAGIDTPPDRVNSLLLAFICIWSGEQRK